MEALERVVHFARTTGKTVDRHDVICLISYVIETARPQLYNEKPLSDETYENRARYEAHENYLRYLVNMPEYFMAQILIQNQSGQNADAQLERLAANTIERGIKKESAERIAGKQIDTWGRIIIEKFPDPQNKTRQRLEQWLESLKTQFAIYYDRLVNPATCFHHIQKASAHALEAWYGNTNQAIARIHEAEVRLHAFLRNYYFHLLNRVFDASQRGNQDPYTNYLAYQSSTEDKIKYIVSYCLGTLIRDRGINPGQSAN